MNINNNTTSYTAFQAKLDELNNGLDSNKWVDNKLTVRTKNNGFVRVLKNIAGFFFGNMFSHIKASKVSVSLFKYCSQNQEHLDAVNQDKVQNIYKKLGSKTKSSYRKDKINIAALATLQLTPAAKKETQKTEQQVNTPQPTEVVKTEEESKKSEQLAPVVEEAKEETNPPGATTQVKEASTETAPVSTGASKPPPPPTGPMTKKKYIPSKEKDQGSENIKPEALKPAALKKTAALKKPAGIQIPGFNPAEALTTLKPAGKTNTSPLKEQPLNPAEEALKALKPVGKP